jgi:hypothetical protein
MSELKSGAAWISVTLFRFSTKRYSTLAGPSLPGQTKIKGRAMLATKAPRDKNKKKEKKKEKAKKTRRTHSKQAHHGGNEYVCHYEAAHGLFFLEGGSFRRGRANKKKKKKEKR